MFWFFGHEAWRTLCDPMDCSPSGSSVHGLLQARILEWVAIHFCTDRPEPGIELGSPALQAYSLPSKPPGKPTKYIYFHIIEWVILNKTYHRHDKWWFPSSSKQICPSRPNVCALPGVQQANKQEQKASIQ